MNRSLSRAVVFMLPALLFGWLQVQAATAPPPVQSGDRWCVLGDSITRSGQYHRYVELFYLTRFPGLKLDVINCGISGDTAPGALRRLQWDCFDAKPTVVSVMLGMNDVAPGSFLSAPPTPQEATGHAVRAAQYEQSVRTLTRTLTETGVRVILLTPSPYDDTANLKGRSFSGCGAALAGYAETVRRLAMEFNVPCVDVHGPMASINADQQKRNPGFTIVGGDRIHPTQPGHLVMAYEFLRAQGLTGVVSRIAIDAAAGRVGHLENCAVKDLALRGGEIAFTCTEDALPYPVEDKAKPALDWVPFSREFNREILQVLGLAPGDYTLSIDGKEIRQFMAAQLADGVNLADETNTPQFQQSQAVLAALQRKWDIVAKLRNLAVCEHASWPDAPRPVDLAQMQAKLDARLARAGRTNAAVIEAHRQYLEFKPHEEGLYRAMDAAVDAARRAAQPEPHQFILRRVEGVKE